MQFDKMNIYLKNHRTSELLLCEAFHCVFAGRTESLSKASTSSPRWRRQPRPSRPLAKSSCWRRSTSTATPTATVTGSWGTASSSWPRLGWGHLNFETTLGRPMEDLGFWKSGWRHDNIIIIIYVWIRDRINCKRMIRSWGCKQSCLAFTVESVLPSFFCSGGIQGAWMSPHVFCTRLRYWLWRKMHSWQVPCEVTNMSLSHR